VARIIDHLTQASADDEPAFDVVVPSIPGCGFSEPLRGAHGGPTVQVVAEIFDQLMARLGYHHYVAHGTGWYGIVFSFSLFFPSFWNISLRLTLPLFVVREH
jgi:pimeloyl-ACP methyl ester carboxylesterase